MRAWARGDVATAAAVELLAGQVGWLVRPDFVRDFVEVADGFAWVDWAGAGAAVDACGVPEVGLGL